MIINEALLYKKLLYHTQYYKCGYWLSIFKSLNSYTIFDTQKSHLPSVRKCKQIYQQITLTDFADVYLKRYKKN